MSTTGLIRIVEPSGISTSNNLLPDYYINERAGGELSLQPF